MPRPALPAFAIGIALALAVAPALTGCDTRTAVERAANAQPSDPSPGAVGASDRRGDFLGETPPARAAQVFAPGLVSTAYAERDMAISPDGGRIFYTVMQARIGTLVGFRRDDTGAWEGPQVPRFSGLHSDIEPAFAPSGDALYFASQRPLPGETEPGDWNVWVVETSHEGWTEPRPVAAAATDADEFYPSVTADGALYFTAELPGGLGGEDLWVARPDGSGGWSAPENLGPAINGPGPEFNAFVTADGSRILFGSAREGDHGGGDLYVADRGEDGAWQPARNAGPEVNSPRLDYCPFLTADGRLLFFTSNRMLREPGKPPRRDWQQLVADLESAENGVDSIYWVDASVLDE